ncbi:arginine--tRNA ligase, partial [bacterium]
MDEFSIENLAENILTRWLKTRVETVYGISIEPEVFPPDNSEFGDSTTNLPFNLAGVVKKSPVEIGREIIAENIPEIFSDAQVVGGYINFWLSDEYIHHMIRNIITHPECWGKIINHNPKKIQVEFVSANPTGPLNIVSARAATVGSTLANVLSAIGNNVQTEFYVNDAGNQIKLLTESFNIRIAQIKGENVQLPENAYHGEYLIEYAREYMENDEPIPAMDWILERILAEQKETLHRFRTDFDVWFSEREFRKSGKIEQVLNRLEQKSLIYHNEGAKWFSASKIDPDVEDFVLVKSDGEWAYGLVDIAYHINKFEERQFDIVYTILGPDHHGHKARLETAMNALGHKNKLKIIILQQVNLIENGERVMMSKRAGKLITMDVLVDDVGVDAARYFFLARKAEAHLDFDINLARDTSEENPVYYIQYAYARINGI